MHYARAFLCSVQSLKGHLAIFLYQASKMGQGGRVPSVELYPCVGEQQNWSRLNPCRRGSKGFQHTTGFPLTGELVAGTDS